MALTNKVTTDKIETVKSAQGDWPVIQVREIKQIFEDDVQTSSSYHRYILYPDHDISTITDSTVKSQFEAVMTESAKENYTNYNNELKKRWMKEGE